MRIRRGVTTATLESLSHRVMHMPGRRRGLRRGLALEKAQNQRRQDIGQQAHLLVREVQRRQ